MHWENSWGLKAFQWGFGKKSRFPNKSVGLSTLIHCKLLGTCFHCATISPPNDLQGRVGIVRFKSPSFDLPIANMYFAPSSAKRLHFDTNLKITQWVRMQVLEFAGERVMDILATDFNGKLGVAKHECSFAPHIGSYQLNDEDINGKLLRELMLDLDLLVINTHVINTPTFYPNNGQPSRIDYIAM
jgi:hypothetical protein